MSDPAKPLTPSEMGRRGGARSTAAQKAAGRRNLRSAARARKRALRAQAEAAAQIPIGNTVDEKLAAGREMLAGGASLAAVGRRLKLSRERVRQALGEFAAECRAARRRPE